MKNAWTSPQLTTYGSVEKLTQQQAKEFGSGDGFITIVGVDVPIRDQMGS